MFLPESVKRIIELLQRSSFKAYAVGGCVRDAIMEREVNDYDITTSALPEQVEKLLDENGIKYIETGLKHGTITAIINREPYEITTFRKDGDYSDNRHPNSVVFVEDVKADLSRRDFTMNAIAYNENEGYVDLFGGIKDIENKLIRTVGNPNHRFEEDALRIMRALRFSAQLGFSVEEETKKAIFKNKALLKNIAVERILIELKKLLLGDSCTEILAAYKEVIRVVIPEIKGEFIGALEYAPKKDYIRLALLLADSDNADEILKCLRVSNEIKTKSQALIEHTNKDIENSAVSIKKLLNSLGEALFFDLIEYKKAVFKYLKRDVSELEEIKKEAQRIIEQNEPRSVKELAVNGFDLMQLGFQGKEISNMLEVLLEEVISNPKKNEKEILINIAQRHISRTSPRIKGFDYSKNGAYFVTVCTIEKAQVLSTICADNNVGEGFHTLPRVVLTDTGRAVDNTIAFINQNTPDVEISRYVIMPNHIHLMVEITKPAENAAGGCGNPPLQEIVRRLKTFTTKQYGKPLWQRSFYDHIIRSEEDYINHLQYIDENPKKWLMGKDEYYC